MHDGKRNGHAPRTSQSVGETAFDASTGLPALEQSLTDGAEEDAAARARRRTGDAGLVAFLRRQGFQGPQYQQFITELMDYGWRTLNHWSATGHIFERAARIGRPVPAAMVPGTWRYEDRIEVVTDTVIEGSALFREHGLIRGKWNPTGGACLTTYFVGACMLAFCPVYSRWYKAHRIEQSQLDYHSAGGEDILDALRGIPDHGAVDPAHAAATYDLITRLCPLLPDGQVRAAVGWMAWGYTQAEAAGKVGMTAKALERRLARIRQKFSAGGPHEGRSEEGGTR